MLWFRAILGGALAVSGVSAFTGNTTGYIDDLFDQSMSFLDQIYDPYAGYLWWFYQPLAAGKHETRSTVWYAAGLLRRNEGDDVDNAVKIITSVIGDQQKNVSAQWYGNHLQNPSSRQHGPECTPLCLFANCYGSSGSVTIPSIPRSQLSAQLGIRKTYTNSRPKVVLNIAKGRH